MGTSARAGDQRAAQRPAGAGRRDHRLGRRRAVSVYTSHVTGITASLAGAPGARGAGEVGTAGCAWRRSCSARWPARGSSTGDASERAVGTPGAGGRGGADPRFGLSPPCRGGRRRLLFVGVLWCTMGLQNAVSAKISGTQIGTAHVTGMITRHRHRAGQAELPPRTPGWTPVHSGLASSDCRARGPCSSPAG